MSKTDLDQMTDQYHYAMRAAKVLREERDALAAQVASLREALGQCDCLHFRCETAEGKRHDPDVCDYGRLLADTAAAAKAHDEAVRAKALGDAAEALRPVLADAGRKTGPRAIAILLALAKGGGQ